jgi:hypothetical protein
MRWVVACVILVTSVAFSAPAHANSPSCRIGFGGIGGSDCGGSDSGSIPAQPPVAAPGKVPTAWINLPDLPNLPPEPDPTFMTMCNNPDAPSAITYDGSCTPLPVAPGTPTPQQQAQTWAVSFFQRIPMPQPRPQMSSPNGVTGGVHSLDLQIDNEKVFASTTPLGPLRMHAFAKTYVNWGDGPWEAYNSTGAPYPNSEIHHTWNNKGTYTIRVVVSWTAEWSIGQYSGTVGGLATTADIPNWEVHQIRAVITSG